jgi:transposase
MVKFDLMCKKYGITHHFTTPQWPQCNGMVERMIKTLKHGLFVVSSTNLDNWDFQLPRIFLVIEMVFRLAPNSLLSW